MRSWRITDVINSHTRVPGLEIARTGYCSVEL